MQGRPHGADIQVTGQVDSAEEALQRTIDLIDEFDKKVRATKKGVNEFNLAFKTLSSTLKAIPNEQRIDSLAESLKVASGEAVRVRESMDSIPRPSTPSRGNKGGSSPSSSGRSSESVIIDFEKKKMDLEQRREQVEEQYRKIQAIQSFDMVKNMRAMYSTTKDLSNVVQNGKGFGQLMSTSFSLAQRGLAQTNLHSSGVTNYINNEAGNMLVNSAGRGVRPRPRAGATTASTGAGAVGRAGAVASGGGGGAVGGAAVAGTALVGGAVVLGVVALIALMGALGKKGQEAELKIAQAYTVMSDNFDDAFKSLQKYNEELGVSDSRLASILGSASKLTSSQGFNAGQSAKMAESVSQLSMAIAAQTGDNVEDVSKKVEAYLQGQDSLQEYNIREGGYKAWADAEGLASVNAQLSTAKDSLIHMQYAIYQFNNGALSSVQPANELQRKIEALKSTMDSVGEKTKRLFVPVFEVLVDLGYAIAQGLEYAIDGIYKMINAFRQFTSFISGKEFKPIDFGKDGAKSATNNIKDLTADYQKLQEEIQATQGALFKFDEVNNLTSYDNDLSSLDKMDEVQVNKELKDTGKRDDLIMPIKLDFKWRFPTFPNAFSISLAFVESLSAQLKWLLDSLRSGLVWQPQLAPVLVLVPVLDWLLDTVRNSLAWQPQLSPVPVFEPVLDWLLDTVRNGYAWQPQLAPVLVMLPLLEWMLNKLYSSEGFDFKFNFSGETWFTETLQPALVGAVQGVNASWESTLANLQLGLAMIEVAMANIGELSQQYFYNPVMDFLQWVQGILTTVGDALAQFGSTIWGWVTGVDWGQVLSVVATILDVVSVVLMLTGVGAGVGAGVKAAGFGVRGASLAVKGARVADGASDAVKGGNALSGLFKGLNTVPSYDTGGVALKPHIAQIGMSGGELALPLASKSAEPAYRSIASNLQSMMQGGGGGGGGHYTFEIHIAERGNVIADNYSVKKFAETITTQVEHRLKQTGILNQGVRR